MELQLLVIERSFKMEFCGYCNRERNYSCKNTRDMEDSAESGDRECFFRLAELGGGEKGLDYVIAHSRETHVLGS